MQFTPFLTFPLRTGSLVLATLLSAGALAAELGDASVRSYIGQQLSADIELVALTPDDLAGLQVKLAQPNVYQGANITMNPALAGLRLTVVKREQRQFLHITTFQPVEADYLHLYLELNAGGRQEVRLATLWLQPDPHPAPPPPPVPALSDAALVAARARASRPPSKPRVPLEAPVAELAHEEAAAPAVRKALGPKDLAAAIAAKLPGPKVTMAAPDQVAPVPAVAARPPPLKGMAAPAACAAQSAGMAAKECAALDAHNAVLTSKLGELEGKLKALQLTLEGNAPAAPAPAAAPVAAAKATAAEGAAPSAGHEMASASAAAAASAEAASASASASAAVPTKMVKVLPKLKHKKDKAPEQGVSTGILAAAGAGVAAVLGGLAWWWLKRRKAKGAAPLKIWQGWRKKKAPEATPEPAPPLSEVTPESLQ